MNTWYPILRKLQSVYPSQWVFFLGEVVYFCRSSILLCTVGELAGLGSVAVAVDVSDRWQVTGDRWQVTCDTWHMTHDTWHMIVFCFVRFCPFSVLVSVLVVLFAHIDRFSVSCMRDFIFLMSLIMFHQSKIYLTKQFFTNESIVP